MYTIQTLNAISKKGLAKLPQDAFTVADDAAAPDGIILRSYKMHGMALPQSVLGIARAGAGTNNIPVDEYADNGVVVFNTPGANANAVKELVIAGLLLSSRKIADGIAWVKTLAGKDDIPALVEKGKKDFVGPEIKGKTLGVIGLGAIGMRVANVAVELGMDVIGYDPFMSVDTAWRINSAVKHANDMETVVANSDYITLHIPCNDQTKGFYNEKLFAATKKSARLINYARGELVDAAALKAALADGTLACYVTDFADESTVALPNTIVTPHLGASTPESEENCAVMAAMQLRDFLQYGNIHNSVNYPNCEMPYTPGKARVAIANKNVPNMLSRITAVLAEEKLNIDNMTNKSRGERAYTLIDLDTLNGKGAALVQKLQAIDGVIKVRIVIEQ